MTLIAAHDNNCNSPICIIFTRYYFPPKNTYYEYSMTYLLDIHVASLLIRQITSLSIISFMPSLRAHSLTSTCCCMHQKIHFDCSTENQQVHWPPFLVLSKIEWCMHLDISGIMQSSPRKFKQIINNKAFWGCNMVTNTKITTIINVSPALSIQWYMQLNYMLQILAARLIHIQIISLVLRMI